MRARFFRLWLALALLVCVSATWAQSSSGATAQNKGIDAAVLAKAQAGDEGAQYQLGYMYYHGDGVRRDYSQAEFWYRKAAEQGDPDSQLKLGGLYHFGEGVPQDSAEAFAWSMKAAEQGKPDAEFFIAACYSAGWGVAQDDAQAAVWLRKAAEQGHFKSQYLLGWWHEIGLGGPKDFAEAYFWLDLAASGEFTRKDRKENLKRRDEAASHLSPAELSQVQERVQQWIKDHPAQSQ